MTNEEAITKLANIMHDDHYAWHPSILTAFGMAVDALRQASRQVTGKLDLISRAEAIAVADYTDYTGLAIEDVKRVTDEVVKGLKRLPSAQPEIIHCKECKYGVQDEDEWWYCEGFGCQVGEEDGSGFCADAERRTDEKNT